MANNGKAFKMFFIILLSGIGLCIIIVIGYFALILSATGFFDKTYTTENLVDNFNKKRVEIYELKRYFTSILPARKGVEIEFDGDNEIARWGIYPNDPGNPDITIQFLDWNIETESKKADSLLKVLGWTHQTLKNIKQKLDAADCISVQSGDPAKIGFQRSGMAMYFFNVFDKPIPDSLKSHYNDSCTYVYANNKLVLEYGGGAIGGQCFAKTGK